MKIGFDDTPAAPAGTYSQHLARLLAEYAPEHEYIIDGKRCKEFDLYHGFRPGLPFPVLLRRIPCVMTVHNLNFLRYPHLYSLGERLVLLAQQLGLNTCWVAMTYSKIRTAFEVRSGEKLCIVIAIGYGLTQGAPHKSKAFGDVAQIEGDVPNWFEKGIEAALLAPTAMNQQKFMFTLKDNQVSVKAGMGFYAKIDLGIVKYHFEVGAGETGWEWGA